MKQYAASPVINKLIDDRRGYFDNGWQDQFYSVVWNVDTAQGNGLDIWGRIVGADRYLEVLAGDYFGFSTSPTQSWAPFGQAPFYVGQNQTSVFKLQDPAYRALVLTKALTNISATDARSLNRVLANLFPGRGAAYVKDLGGMEIQYVFEFFLEPWEAAIIATPGVLPRPAGVKVSATSYNILFPVVDALYRYANVTLPADLSIPA